jgi:MSHA type pilus biogenesis protein MshL
VKAWLHCALWAGPALLSQTPPGLVSIAVGQGDLKDILRAATAQTDLNLIFEPGLETRVEGLSLKNVSLDELLGTVVPALGLSARREGRTIYIQKAAAGMTFYPVEQLAIARSGTQSFSVNASGQVIQAGGSGGGGTGSGGNSSASTSTVQMGHASDPWADLESGLMLVVFGKGQVPAAAPGTPSTRSFAANGKALLIQPNSGLVGVAADPATQAQVAAYLRENKARTQRQVLLEARIVEVTLGQDSQMGVDWSTMLSPGGSSASFSSGLTLNSNVSPDKGLFRLVAQGNRVQAALSALARDNRLKVLSAPRLSALNNQKAILRVVREEAYGLPSSQITPGTAAGGAVATGQLQPLIVPVGIVLDIQPQIGDDGFITLAVNPSISEVAEERSFSIPSPADSTTVGPTVVLPVVDRRDLDTVVRIRTGETLVLAGIIRSKETVDNRGVPWLRKIPLLGSLFAREERSRTRTELAIFISPTLMEESAPIQAARRSAEEGIAGIVPPPRVP